MTKFEKKLKFRKMLQKLKNNLPSALDHCLILHPATIFWATGFAGSFARLLVSKSGEAHLITDPRYLEKAEFLAKKSDFAATRFDQNFEKNFGKKIRGIIGIDPTATLAQFQKIRQNFPNAKFRTQTDWIRSLRREKTPAEIQKIRHAQNQIDKILVPLLREKCHPGITEKSLALALEFAVRDHGNFEIAFSPIVAFGKNTSIPHHHPTDQKLQKNQPILIDIGAKFEGFHSDMTRNFWFGDRVDPEYRKKFEILLATQKASLPHFKPGKKVAEIDQFCRKKLGTDAKFFTHSLGHGVGLEINEPPSVAATSREKLLENEVATCEPGLYFPGKFGIRIEDLILIRKNSPEILSKTEKELILI